MLRKLSAAFTGGTVGALVDSVNIWMLGQAGITARLGVGLKPAFTPQWLYPRLVWGGLWGLLLLLPLLKNSPLRRGILFSLAPSAYVLLVVFPALGKGMLGLGLGTLTPLLVIALNLVWGVVAALWYKQGG